MKILFLGNNRAGLMAAKWLARCGDEVVGLVVHPPGRAKCRDEIIREFSLESRFVFDGSRLREPEQVHAIGALGADIAISVYFGYILRGAFIGLFRDGCVNLHPGYLPFNRGSHPNVWSIIDRTPAGVTLHYMDEGVDTGPIIAQREIPMSEIDTGESLYHKLEEESVRLLIDTWPQIRAGRKIEAPKPDLTGSSHRARDLALGEEIDLARKYTAGELIDILRARTFPPYSGAYFRSKDGRKIGVRVQLHFEDET
jgi:methionyl-tRNA formyltransferase